MLDLLLAGSSILTNDQKNQLIHEGYIILGIIDTVAIENLKSIFFEKFHSKSEKGFQSTMTRVQEKNVRQEIYDNINIYCHNTVQKVLPGYEILLANFLFKPPQADSSEVGVHRDWSYVDHTLDNAYNLWIPLDDIDDHNGGFFIIPQSHKVTHGPRSTPFQDELAAFRNKLICLGKAIHLKMGQAILYHPGLIHYSYANNSKSGRLVAGMVCKPIAAKACHYYIDENHQFRKYEVDKEFYTKFDPRFAPDTEYPYIFIENTTGESAIKNWIMEKEKNLGFSPESVGEYYDKTTDDYLATYGNTIQAFRPTNEDDLHKYVIESAGLKKHQKILDAGCGVGGPALFFAQKLNVDITGISISRHQIELAQKFTKEKWLLRGQVNFQTGDYHQMSQIVPESSMDRVLFLESLGHSHQPKVAIEEAFKVLKSGGGVYIKDFFPYELSDKATKEKYDQVVRNINAAYYYHVLDLNHTISQLRESGFEVGYIKKFEFADDIERRSAFESRLNIDLFGDIPEFRVAEWLELFFIKP